MQKQISYGKDYSKKPNDKDANHKDGVDYICITDIARLKNPVEPKDVVKNWLRSKNTLEYLGL